MVDVILEQIATLCVRASLRLSLPLRKSTYLWLEEKHHKQFLCNLLKQIGVPISHIPLLKQLRVVGPTSV